jgi:predicted MPP superfamily phosphohydrolase
MGIEGVSESPRFWNAVTVGFLATTASTIGAVGLGTLSYSLFEAQSFTTREITIPVLPKGSKDLRVLHLSDLHITPKQKRKIKWVRSLSQLDPDLVVVTGDFMAHKDAVASVMYALGDLTSKPGFFVLGSNDYYAPYIKNPFMYFRKNREIKAEGKELPTKDLVDSLMNSGWFDLDNQQFRITVNGVTIHARGTDDPHINKDRYDLVAGPYDSFAFALGVTHAPYRRVLNKFAADQADLVLAGHTHGGQVCIPFYGALVTNCDLPTGKAKGLSTFEFEGQQMPLHVSAGVGTSPFTPIRLACRPEATLLTLTAKN